MTFLTDIKVGDSNNHVQMISIGVDKIFYVLHKLNEPALIAAGWAAESACRYSFYFVPSSHVYRSSLLSLFASAEILRRFLCKFSIDSERASVCPIVLQISSRPLLNTKSKRWSFLDWAFTHH
jgi:hypothetical protein